MTKGKLALIFIIGLFIGVLLVSINLLKNKDTFKVKSISPMMTVVYDPEFERPPKTLPTVPSSTTKIIVTMSSAIDKNSRIGVTTNNQDSFSTSIANDQLIITVTSATKQLNGGSTYSIGVSGLKAATSKKQSSFVLRFKTDGINKSAEFINSLPYVGSGYVIIYSVVGNYYTVITEKGFNPTTTKADALTVLQKNSINTSVADIRYESR